MFFGKNKVMMVALGRSPCDEYKDNLHQVSLCPSLGGAEAPSPLLQSRDTFWPAVLGLGGGGGGGSKAWLRALVLL